MLVVAAVVAEVVESDMVVSSMRIGGELLGVASCPDERDAMEVCFCRSCFLFFFRLMCPPCQVR